MSRQSEIDRPVVVAAGLERLGEGGMSLLLGDRRLRLTVGPEGLRLVDGETVIGASGWEAFAGFMAHQKRRADSLIGERRVPASLLDHPAFDAEILPHLYANAYMGDRLARGGSRRRIEALAPSPEVAERLLSIEVACANPTCLHTIRPFRARARAGALRLFVGFTCPIEESLACARTKGAKEAMEALASALERRGRVSVNDVKRR